MPDGFKVRIYADEHYFGASNDFEDDLSCIDDSLVDFQFLKSKLTLKKLGHLRRLFKNFKLKKHSTTNQ